MKVRTRLTILLSTVILAVMFVVLSLLRYRIGVSAIEQATSGMLQSRESFESYLAQTNQSLLTQCSLIADLPILKATIETHHHNTVLSSALEYRKKIGVDAIVVTDGHGKLLARTDAPGQTGTDMSSVPFVRAALDGKPWLGGVADERRIYQIVSVPVGTGDHLWGTLSAVYAFSDATARAMQHRMGTELSFVDGDHILASSLGMKQRSALARFLKVQLRRGNLVFQSFPQSVSVGGKRWLLSMTPMTRGRPHSAVYYVLQESPDRLTGRFHQLQSWLILIGLLSLALGLVASIWMSRTITHPVSEMVRAVKSIESGQWDHRVNVLTNDEFAVLGQSFNRMTEQLQRDLEQQEILQSFLQKMLNLREVQSLLDETVADVTRVSPFASAGIYMPSDNLSELRLRARTGNFSADIPGAISLASSSLATDCFNQNAVLTRLGKDRVPFDVRDDVVSEGEGTGEDRAALVAIPLAVESSVLGVLVLHTGPGQVVDDSVMRPARMIVDGAAAALERTRLFEAVLSAKVEWETTFDAVSLPIFLRDRNNAIFRFNKAAAAYFGIDPQDISHLRPSIPCRGCDLSDNCPARKCWETDQHQRAEMTATDTGRIYAVHAFPIHGSHDQVSAVLEYVVDITAEKQEAQRMLHLERLRALGEVASGVAHDFNNVLTSIYGYAQLLADHADDPGVREKATLIGRSAEDAAAIVRRMQTFYKAQSEAPLETIDINLLLQEVLNLTRPRWKDGAEASGFPLTIESDWGDTQSVRGKPSELREVFTNLILNALDAMPQGGTLTIRTYPEDRRAVVAVSDTGTGMSEEVKKRIFESFFTTKGSQGTGLGLSLAYNIISTHGGEISVDSAPLAGSTFTVKLPTETVGAEQAQKEALKKAPALRILLVDDDPKVRSVVAAILVREGHEVVEAPGGYEALDHCSQGRFDLVITDLGMPEMNGRELVNRLKSQNPNVPVIMMTGWKEQLDEEELKQEGVGALIGKPVNIEHLRRAIVEITASSTPGEIVPAG